MQPVRLKIEVISMQKPAIDGSDNTSVRTVSMQSTSFRGNTEYAACLMVSSQKEALSPSVTSAAP
jgi:hypothetical protein